MIDPPPYASMLLQAFNIRRVCGTQSARGCTNNRSSGGCPNTRWGMRTLFSKKITFTCQLWQKYSSSYSLLKVGHAKDERHPFILENVECRRLMN